MGTVTRALSVGIHHPYDALEAMIDIVRLSAQPMRPTFARHLQQNTIPVAY
jgi:hypothetical protein